jgi:hypothetical protein
VASFTFTSVPVDSAGLISPTRTVPASISSVQIDLTACPEWDTTAGTFSWGVYGSLDNGATFVPLISQDLAIGSRSRQGKLPSLKVSMEGQTGVQMQARASTNGPTLTCSFLITAL